MDLVPKVEKRQLWYKCDAFTCLDIMSKNEYGLRASLYSSDEFVAKKPKGKGTSVMRLMDGQDWSL
jgi:hypothetical protein